AEAARSDRNEDCVGWSDATSRVTRSLARATGASTSETCASKWPVACCVDGAAAGRFGGAADRVRGAAERALLLTGVLGAVPWSLPLPVSTTATAAAASMAVAAAVHSATCHRRDDARLGVLGSIAVGRACGAGGPGAVTVWVERGGVGVVGAAA